MVQPPQPITARGQKKTPPRERAPPTTTVEAIELHDDDLNKGLIKPAVMYVEQFRITSFKFVPDSLYKGVWPTKLAKAGFYYDVRTGDTYCFVCRLRKPFLAWVEGVDPLAVHKEEKPECEFVNGTCTENIAFITEQQRKNRLHYLAPRNDYSQRGAPQGQGGACGGDGRLVEDGAVESKRLRTDSKANSNPTTTSSQGAHSNPMSRSATGASSSNNQSPMEVPSNPNPGPTSLPAFPAQQGGTNPWSYNPGSVSIGGAPTSNTNPSPSAPVPSPSSNPTSNNPTSNNPIQRSSASNPTPRASSSPTPPGDPSNEAAVLESANQRTGQQNPSSTSGTSVPTPSTKPNILPGTARPLYGTTGTPGSNPSATSSNMSSAYLQGDRGADPLRRMRSEEARLMTYTR